MSPVGRTVNRPLTEITAEHQRRALVAALSVREIQLIARVAGLGKDSVVAALYGRVTRYGRERVVIVRRKTRRKIGFALRLLGWRVSLLPPHPPQGTAVRLARSNSRPETRA